MENKKMIAEIGSLIASLRVAYDIAKGIGALKSEVDRNESISKILEILIAVQTNALSVNAIAQELQEEKTALKQKIVEFEKWAETETQYELKEIAPALFVYSYKKSNDSIKPPHWLCAKCFSEKKAHIIQLDRESAGGKHFFCPNCKTKYYIRHDFSIFDNKLAESYST